METITVTKAKQPALFHSSGYMRPEIFDWLSSCIKMPDFLYRATHRGEAVGVWIYKRQYISGQKNAPDYENDFHQFTFVNDSHALLFKLTWGGI